MLDIMLTMGRKVNRENAMELGESGCRRWPYGTRRA
jgi:hypothetical protein